VQRFNEDFLARLDLSEKVMLPCVVFFKVKDDRITDVKAVHLESADLIHGFHELYGVVANYISETPNTPAKESRYLRWIKSSAKFVTVEAFRAWIDAALADVM